MFWIAILIGVLFLIRNIRKAKKEIKDWEGNQHKE
jgi:hypothetical protein